MKQCSKCGETDPAKFKKGKSRCKKCSNMYSRHTRQRDPEKHRLLDRKRNAEYVKANPEKDAARKLKYRKANPEIAAETNRIYRKENREAIADWNRKWREENREAIAARRDPEKIAAGKRKWLEANPGYNAAAASLRRARERNATPAWFEKDAVFTLFSNTAKGEHVDHVIPLVNDTVCGLHCLANLETIPALDNWSKNNRFDQDLESAKQLEISKLMSR